ncbi:hypothetical protein [Rhodococcus sp. KRD162]|uniref:hypothetical protein n=1 Tax=Rhodococcus sp. KRD162 TaxID=2729725 RepID=UPI0019D22A67|nr:hypothetical protein [Rhodococcus sp. KRD162]
MRTDAPGARCVLVDLLTRVVGYGRSGQRFSSEGLFGEGFDGVVRKILLAYGLRLSP